MSTFFRLPKIDAPTEREQLAQIKSYLAQFIPQLEWALNNIEKVETTATASTSKSLQSYTVARSPSSQQSYAIARSPSSQQIDFPVEEGISGIWYYRKWNSGRAECWGTASILTNFTKGWANQYTCSTIDRQNYPFTFIERPVETVTIRGTICFGYSEAGAGGMNSQTQTAQYCASRPTELTDNVTVYIDYHISGRWK